MTTFDRFEAARSISDLSKDAIGFRVRVDLSTISDDELRRQQQYYADAVVASIDEEKNREAKALADFTVRIEKLAADLSVSFATALRWTIDAEDVDGDYGYFCFRNDLPYEYEHEISRILNSEK